MKIEFCSVRLVSTFLGLPRPLGPELALEASSWPSKEDFDPKLSPPALGWRVLPWANHGQS